VAGLNYMAETTAMSTVHFYYWAGAKAAAGRATEAVEAETVRAALLQVGDRDHRFRSVLAACTLLLDGLAAHEDDLDRPLRGEVRVEVLPPFAGGAGR
jgi:molybdopterin synthase sulfur carrier subunit